MDSRLNGPATALRVAFGLMATLAGLDKFFNLLTQWDAYVAPVAVRFSPISTSALMGAVGIVEIAAGVTILALRPALGAFVAGAWLLLVAVNLVLGGYFDIAVRDVVLATAAFMLGRLEQVRSESDERATAPAGQRRSLTA